MYVLKGSFNLFIHIYTQNAYICFNTKNRVDFIPNSSRLITV